MPDSRDPIRWLARAEQDALSIANNVAADRVPWNAVAFDAHQCAEKALKALLLARDVEPARTHDLERLRRSVADAGLPVDDLQDDCDLLNGLVLTGRYPDEVLEDVREAQGREAAEAAQRVLGRVRALILETAGRGHA